MYGIVAKIAFKIRGTELEKDEPMSNAITRVTLFMALLAASMVVEAGVQEGIQAYKNKDYATAVKEFVPPAENGDPVALFYVALMYENSEGLPQNYAQAMVLYRRAADKGFAPAQCNLGVMYETKAGPDRSYKDAAFWYRKAAEQGDASAQFNLGLIYYIGRGSDIPRGRKTAAAWYTKAAEQGHVVAQYNLGMLNEYGQGMPVSLEGAYKWYSLAAGAGHAQAVAAKKAVSAKMSSDMIESAGAQVKEWLASHKK